MKFTDHALELLKHLEGCRLTAYRDEAGIWTIGYGHTGKDVRPGLTWTPSQADAALAQDLQRFDTGVREILKPAELTDNQFSALVVFAFNVGLSALHGSTAMRKVRLGLLEHVPDAIALWNKVHDRSGVPLVSEVLVKRRAAEGQLWRTA